MKARIKFQKYGPMKFVGHLDVMRYFQKAFRRADIDSEYTKGFSPHQIMSFAAPLGVGLTSDAEYVDVQLLSSESPEEMVRRMNSVITEGFRVIGFYPLPEREGNQKNVTAMALVVSADYLVSLRDGYEVSESIHSQAELAEAFSGFLRLQEIVINKKTKTCEKAVNIRPMLTMAAFGKAEYEEKCKDTLADYAGNASAADVYANGIKIYMRLDTGSSANLKPELVMEALYAYLGQPYEKSAWQVHRIEIYTRDAESGKLAALDQVKR